MTYRVFTGDDKGQIKSVLYNTAENTLGVTLISTGETKAPIQQLRSCRQSDSSVLAATQSDGRILAYSYSQGSDDLRLVSQWKETRISAADKFVGLEAIATKGWLSCTQHGRLRLSHLPTTPEPTPEDLIGSLPMRLNSFQLSPSSTALAYGGDEVDLSVWDVERTFSEKPSKSIANDNDLTGKKRKKGKGDLMYAEIWRAKQLPNDTLSLRQPVHITSLAFLHTSSTTQQPPNHIITGNKSGAVRRFDTRAARRPVASWEGVAKTGGIKGVERGRNEHEIFVSDNGSNLSAIDVRNGKICYSYKGIAGATTSIAPVSASYLASVSLDRMLRFHSVFAPPAQPADQQLKKGAVLTQEFLKSTPTTVVWDRYEIEQKAREGDGDEDVWEGMEVRGGQEQDSDESDEEHVQKRSRN